MAHEFLKELRGADLPHEVAVNDGAVNGTGLNGAHTTGETLALVTPVEAEEGSGPVVEVCGVIQVWGRIPSTYPFRPTRKTFRRRVRRRSTFQKWCQPQL